MTYQKLLDKLEQMNEDQLGCDLTICSNDDECFVECCLDFADEDIATSLDEGHPVIYFIQ